MKYLYLFIACLMLIACKKEEVEPQSPPNEVIPPPPPLVDLTSHFDANIGGATIEFAENVNGYEGFSIDSLYENPSPVVSEAVYYFGITSASSSMAIEIVHGSVFWDNAISSIPSLSEFNEFHLTDTIPNYAMNGMQGFEVIFTDNFGGVWKSDPTSLNAQSVTFNNIVQESGGNGDFSKFQCNFTCYVYNSFATDSLLIDNAVLQGWFSR